MARRPNTDEPVSRLAAWSGRLAVFALVAAFISVIIVRGDLLGGFTLEPEHYVTWVERIRDRFSDTPLLAVLEGGYVPSRLADGVVAVAQALAR